MALVAPGGAVTRLVARRSCRWPLARQGMTDDRERHEEPGAPGRPRRGRGRGAPPRGRQAAGPELRQTRPRPWGRGLREAAGIHPPRWSLSLALHRPVFAVKLTEKKKKIRKINAFSVNSKSNMKTVVKVAFCVLRLTQPRCLRRRGGRPRVQKRPSPVPGIYSFPVFLRRVENRPWSSFPWQQDLTFRCPDLK